MVKKATIRKEEPDLTLEFDGLPVTESEAITLPVSESETTTPPVLKSETPAIPVTEVVDEAPSEQGNKAPQDVVLLSLKIAELENKLVELQTEFNNHLNKKKNKKERKAKKVKCKCKDKTVDVDKCKCASKKLDK